MDELDFNNINEKWQILLWRIIAIICGITMLIEFLCLKSNARAAGISNDLFMVKYIIIPAAAEIVILLSAGYFLKLEKIGTESKNWIISVMMFLIYAIIAYNHSSLVLVIFLPSVAVAATALFADNAITFVLTIFNVVSVVVDMLRAKRDYRWDSRTYLGNVIIALIVAVTLCVIIIIVNMHTFELKEAIKESYVKQLSLGEKMNKDPMTGLYNRRSFLERLEKEIENVTQTGKKAFIAIFDIDHFKNVNDTYGHTNGDVVIKALCKMLKKKSEDCGIAFRYGGEEFVILFSDVELPKVINVVEDIRTEFRCYYFQFMLKDGITCSCGVAEYQTGEEAKAWFNRADAALYEAKEAGRNRTVVSK